tara:strand:+ start:6164 stop:7093 length:930 start_codon:yes stop_codon:yes gene_type:complete
MSKQSELASLIQKNDLVRRVSDIEVEEITLTKKGALGDEADAIILFKEDNSEEIEQADKEVSVELEKTGDEEVADDVASVEVELEKATEEVADKPELTCEDALQLLKSQELTDEQKDSVLQFASSLFEDVDLVKEDEVALPESGKFSFPGLVFSTEQRLQPQQVQNLWKDLKNQHEMCEAHGTPMIVHSGLKLENGNISASSDAMQLLKSIKESIDNMSLKRESEEVAVDDIVSEPVAIEKEIEKPVSVLDEVDQILRKSQDEKQAQGRASQDAAILEKLDKLASEMAGIQEKFNRTRRTLDRACGEDA